MNNTLKELLPQVRQVALETGRYQAEQRRTFSRDRVESKHRHDYVSYVDRESEHLIVERLRALLPEASFVTEEKTTEQSQTDSGFVWIIDPLDGTTNFIHDLGPWCVAIALQHDGELVLGVVYEVTRGDMFSAVKGEGAWLHTTDGHEQRLQVSDVCDLDQAIIAVGHPYNTEAYRDFCVGFTRRVYGRCASLRSLGSAEAEICYVAAGRLDAYLEAWIQPWDVSAGAVILREAGGCITDHHGTDALWPSGREVLATNSHLHRALVEEIAQCPPQKD